MSDKEWQIINHKKHAWQEDYTVPEREVDSEQSEVERRKNTNLRILELIHGLPADKKETFSTQQVDISAGKHLKGGNSLFGWTATDRPLDVLSDNQLEPSTIDGDVDKYFCPGSGGRTFPHRNFNYQETQGNKRD